MTDILLKDIDMKLLEKQYQELQDITPADSIVWGLIQVIGDAI
jgi:hypothetical protein